MKLQIIFTSGSVFTLRTGRDMTLTSARIEKDARRLGSRLRKGYPYLSTDDVMWMARDEQKKYAREMGDRYQTEYRQTFLSAFCAGYASEGGR